MLPTYMYMLAYTDTKQSCHTFFSAVLSSKMISYKEFPVTTVRPDKEGKDKEL